MRWFKDRIRRFLFFAIPSLLGTVALPLASAQSSLIATGSLWRYWDSGSNNIGWEQPGFDDSAWQIGPSPFGYGFNGSPQVTTQLRSRSDQPPFPQIITAYFRHAFFFERAPMRPATLRVRRDDGVVIYINGREVFRNNMPSGVLNYATSARALGAPTAILQASVDASFLVGGSNIIAAEVHDYPPAATEDLFFDLEMPAIDLREDPLLMRGPYLQSGTPTSVIVKWRTDLATNSVVHYGTNATQLDHSAFTLPMTDEHEVQLTGLLPDTRYFYSIGSSGGTLASGADFFLITAPAQPKPTRIWAIGDSGTGSAAARDVWLSYSNFTRGRYTDLWLMLGDNAYESGTDQDYQRGMFDMYPDILRQTVVWPTIGNHDFDPAYFNIFSLPRNGEAGGVPSGVENYYSFDYGDIHFVCLGGYYSGSRSSNGVMCTWLRADLEANTSKWLIAYWHQPPYTHGSHSSDAELDLIEMRANAVPILESYGVDLVLNGHSHGYERSYLIHGHYGDSSTLEPFMVLDNGSGRISETGPYLKRTSGPSVHLGTVYVVAGSSGMATFGSMDHPAMCVSWLRMGSLVLDVNGNTLHGTFLRETGEIDDYFTLIKGDTVVRILNVAINDGAATISWSSAPERHYQLEFSANLVSPWTKIGALIYADGATTTSTHHVGGMSQGFFRVLQID